ncbi:hypothetical protein D3C78_1821790 [compost metagenome]
MGNGLQARLGALHGIAYRRRQNTADAAGFADGQQPCQVVLMQARTRRIMHQHPLRVTGSLQTR